MDAVPFFPPLSKHTTRTCADYPSSHPRYSGFIYACSTGGITVMHQSSAPWIPALHTEPPHQHWCRRRSQNPEQRNQNSSVFPWNYWNISLNIICVRLIYHWNGRKIWHNHTAALQVWLAPAMWHCYPGHNFMEDANISHEFEVTLKDTFFYSEADSFSVLQR